MSLVMRHSFDLFNTLGRAECIQVSDQQFDRLERVNTHLCVQRLCRMEILPDNTGVGLGRFHSIVYTAAPV